MDQLNNATDRQKHALLLGYIIYFVVAIMVVNVVLQKIAARRQREEAAIVEAFVRQQDYSQWVERYGIARRVDGIVDGA
jgi:hypothetical protein